MSRPLLTEPALLVLISLTDEARDVRELGEQLAQLPGTNGHFSTSQLYGFLDRMHRRGLVRVAAEEHLNGRVHRRFRATEAGLQALRAESVRWRRLAEEAEQRINGCADSA